MRKALTRTAGLLALLLAGAWAAAHFIVPPKVDRHFNRVDRRPPYRVSERASRLHRTLTVADLHADSLIWGRDLLRRSDRGQVDLPRLREANVALQVFSVPTKVPRKRSRLGTSPDQLNLITASALAQLWPPSTWFRLDSRAVYLARALHRDAERSAGGMAMLASARELDLHLERRTPGGPVGALLAIEGLHALEGKLANVDRLFVAGYRMMGLVHQFDNRVGGSSQGLERGGLTPFGEKVVRRLEELGVVVDLAHASPALIRDVLSIATRPVVVSHTGVRGTCDRPRSLSDEEIRGIADSGGLVGIGFWSGATCGTDARAVAAAARYVADLVGTRHVALGSDFDGDSLPFDVTGIPQITEALMEKDFDEEEIREIAGGNVVRLLREALPAADS